MAVFGPLTHHIQVKAAIALAFTTNRGICIDTEKRDQTESLLRSQVDTLIQNILKIPGTENLFKRSRDGEILLTPTGSPQKSSVELSNILTAIGEEHDIDVPLTEKSKKPTTARKFWSQFPDIHPFIDNWTKLDETTKLTQFFKGLSTKTVHSGYVTLVRTGRTGARKPNIQQIPSGSEFRSLFIPRVESSFVIIDYSALELRTLAAVCENQIGYSKLSEIFRQDIDPHCYTASLILNIPLAEFTENLSKNPKYKKARQQAKAINFGIPGGLSAPSLTTYAKTQYGVDMSLQEARNFRHQFLYKIYPEIGEYMAFDLHLILAHNLRADPSEVYKEIGGRDGTYRAQQIVKGRKNRRTGEDFTKKHKNRVWQVLSKLNNNKKLGKIIEERSIGYESEQSLFMGPSVTLTGRIRGNTIFTARKNTPFQGLAADGAKLALWSLIRSGYHVVAFVHDEFVIEIPKCCDQQAAAKDIDRICCQSMEQVTGSVPIKCEWKITDRWCK